MAAIFLTMRRKIRGNLFFVLLILVGVPTIFAQTHVPEKSGSSASAGNNFSAKGKSAAAADRSPTASGEKSRYPISKRELQNALLEIDQLLHREGAWLEAKARYATLLQQDLLPEDRKMIQGALETLNMKILFSPILTPDSFSYTVQPGDSLFDIAKKFHTTAEFIQKSNRLTRDLIRPGMKLKIIKTKFGIVVSKSENKLSLFADKELVKIYPVATGKNDSTPIGTFTIENKLINPVWYKTGAVLPPGSPDNILGTRWLGFSLQGYGIHGTTLPETIGKHASEGCIRMYNQDVEELYTIVPIKTTVTVVD